MRKCCGGLLLAPLVVLSAVTACGAATTDMTSDRRGDTTVGPTASLAHPSTIRDLVTMMAGAGLAVPNPRDVTQRDCPEIDCTNKIHTDTVSILSFPATGSAQLYAGSKHDVFQIGRIVLMFPESMPSHERLAYQRVLKRAVE